MLKLSVVTRYASRAGSSYTLIHAPRRTVAAEAMDDRRWPGLATALSVKRPMCLKLSKGAADDDGKFKLLGPGDRGAASIVAAPRRNTARRRAPGPDTMAGGPSAATFIMFDKPRDQKSYEKR